MSDAGNNAGIGPIQPHTGNNAKAIERDKGYDATVEAMQSKTRSQYPHVDKHYHYEDTSFDGSMISERGHKTP